MIKNIATRHEDYRKRHESLALKLLAERDGVYSELKKAKTAYDMECKEVEEKRQKMDKDASKGKAQRSYQSELMEMNNIKVRDELSWGGDWKLTSPEYVSSPDRSRE